MRRYVMEPSKSTTVTVGDEKLVEIEAHRDSCSSRPEDVQAVLFNAGDPNDPVNWPITQKWGIAILVASMNLISVFATCAIIPAAPQAMADLRASSAFYQTLLVSIWELGEGIGPFFVAPLAEHFGRAPVFHVGNAFGVVWSVAGALSTNVRMLVAFRFLNGFSGTALTLGPAIIGDLFVPEQRGSAMTIVMGMQVLGSFIAPICGSFIAANVGWRWTAWISAIAFGTVGFMSLFVVRETYAVITLAKRGQRGKEEEAPTSKPKAKTDLSTIIESITRPLWVMVQSPIVLLISLYTAVVYGSMFLTVTTLTEIMEQEYSFSDSVVGVAFVALAIGNVIGMLFYGLTSDAYVKRKKVDQGDNFKVESRLVHLVLAAGLLPLAFVFYGWTIRFRIHWAVPLVGVGMIGFCTLNTILSTETYLVDAYPIRGASAIAAGVILRAISGAVYPLSGPALYAHLDQGWANTVLAFVLLAFLPALAILLKLGYRFRRKESMSSR